MTQANAAADTAPASATDRIKEGYGSAVHAASDAYGKAGEAARRAAHELEANPVAVLAGGLALGALVGTLIPRSAREKELLAPVGTRLAETARGAVQAAREAGYAELEQRGLSRSAAKDQARSLLDGVGQALSSAGSAAAKATTGKTGSDEATSENDGSEGQPAA